MFDMNRKLKGLLEDQIPRVVSALEYVHTFLAERAEPKWEYLRLAPFGENLDIKLDTLGRMGWELVWVRSIDRGLADQYSIILKRRRVE